MADYCVIGIGTKERGVRLQTCSQHLKGKDAFETLKKKMFDIHLPEAEQSPALCVMPLGLGKIAVSEITHIKKNEVETRPHSLQHIFITESEEFLTELKDGLDDKRLDGSFFHGPMKMLEAFEQNGKLDYKKIELCTEMSGFWNGLTKQQQWNFFVNLVMGKQRDMKLALGVDDHVNRRNVLADVFRILPRQYAADMSALSSGECAQTEFDLLLVSSTRDSDIRFYKYLLLTSCCNIKSRELVYLKSIVTGPDELRREFYDSKYMNPYPLNAKKLMNFEEMEEAAIQFLVEKGIVKEPPIVKKKGKKKTEATEEKYDLRREMEAYYQSSHGRKPSYDIAMFRRHLFMEYQKTSPYEVRTELRKQLREWLVVYGNEDAFMQLALLTYEMTDEEYADYRKNNPCIICSAPYYYKEFQEFLRNSGCSRFRINRFTKQYERGFYYA